MASSRHEHRQKWPEREKNDAFYFVKVRSFEDPKLRVKLMDADEEFNKKNQAHSKIIEAVRAKKGERSIIISELKSLIAKNKQYHEGVAEKLTGMECLQNRLGMFTDGKNVMQAQGVGLCSSIEELEHKIKMLNDRIIHECISLNEEKRLVKEIKDLEKNRSKFYNTANRAKIQGKMGENEAIQDQVRKEQQAVRSKIKVLEDELKAVDAEIGSMQEDLAAATARKDKAYESLAKLRQARDEQNMAFLENRALLNKARDYASRGMVTELQELHKTKVDEFMAQWCRSKAFREDYESRILSSLSIEQLDIDG